MELLLIAGYADALHPRRDDNVKPIPEESEFKELTCAIIKSAFSQLAILVIGCLMLASTAWLALWWRQNTRAQMRATALPITIKQAQPIIQAIERYESEKQTLPPSLSALLPKYIRTLPHAGPAAKDGWHYETNPVERAGTWSLYIKVRDEFSPNIMGFGDTFVFHPSGRYPKWAYGGG